MNLKESISQLSEAKAKELLEIDCKDQADTDDYIRDKASEVLSEYDAYGDMFGVPTIEDIVDKLVEIIKARDASLKILAENVDL